MLTDRLARLSDYPFARLRALLDGLDPPDPEAAVTLSIGDPQHALPPLALEALAANGHLWNRYPPLQGTEAFRQAAVQWLGSRFGLPAGLVDPDTAILPVSGTREALFMLAQLVAPREKAGSVPAVCLPNPFYAVYEGAAVMAGGQPVFLDAFSETGFLPDLDALEARPGLLNRLALLYLCNPANPQGAIADRAYLARLLGLARHHGFVLAVDECYADIYDGEPPPSALEIAGGSLDRLVVFHSLSKRSNAAGLRAGFLAGDPAIVRAFLRLRAYSAAGMPLPVQAAAVALWGDETHVVENRVLYRAKIDSAAAAFGGRLGFYRPPGGFFLWLDVGDGEAAARTLWTEAGLKVLPGAYLTRPDGDGVNRGRPYIRVALVHDTAVLDRALPRLAAGCAGLAAAA
ncbi:MAG: aminotransferase class I/II-fold pyridoxal phosphate-dependent enzyme [Alphaproteobacteria bacterium]|jgi:aspartate/methionine/tyrosine aminotransferase|nr:aminotransferase class I/II-fold pyridoxal phosphate-dependent enzyme [Alphaproteobacteria bacterium]